MTIDPKAIEQQLAKTSGKDLSTCPPLPGMNSSGNRPAAVLIPLLFDLDTWKILFIKRTVQQNDRHSGQIAFPGGRFDPRDETLEKTALRETFEEIGLDPGSIQLLGQSCSMITVTGYEVTPFVGIINWPTTLALSPEEVERILLVPIKWLLNPENHRVEGWRARTDPNTVIPVIFFEKYDDEMLWGATAQILMDFLDLAGLRHI